MVVKVEINKIYHMDCLEGLKKLPDDSIDTVWTDPPYNINYKYDVYDDDMSLDAYFKWCSEWVKECHRVLKPSGSIFVKMWSRHIFDFYKVLEKHNFIFKNVIVWKRKSCANYTDRYLGGYEVIFFFTKTHNSKFNAEGFLRNTTFLKRWDGKKEYMGRLNDLWDDIKPITAGNLRHSEGCYQNEGGVNGCYQNIGGVKEHPAQHSTELVIRSIKCTTTENDVVLDPFIGSGTTAVACKRLNRKFIGFEISQKYVDLANKRLQKHKKWW